MSKIIQAVNSMISNADSISQVTYGCQGKEIFFSGFVAQRFEMQSAPN